MGIIVKVEGDGEEEDHDGGDPPLLQEKYTGLETARLWKMFIWS